jgi:hypothetical protein
MDDTARSIMQFEAMLKQMEEAGIIEGWAPCPGTLAYDIEYSDGSWYRNTIQVEVK